MVSNDNQAKEVTRFWKIVEYELSGSIIGCHIIARPWWGNEPLHEYSKILLCNVPQQTTWTLRWLSEMTHTDLMEVE